jgi:hypothetical protein
MSDHRYKFTHRIPKNKNIFFKKSLSYRYYTNPYRLPIHIYWYNAEKYSNILSNINRKDILWVKYKVVYSIAYLIWMGLEQTDKNNNQKMKKPQP